MGGVEGRQFPEGVFADYVAVQYEKGTVVFAEDLFGEFEGPGGAEGFSFDGEFNADVVLGFVLRVRVY